MLFFGVMLCLLVYIAYRNFDLIKRYRHNKEYIDCYKEMLSGAEGAYEHVCRYVESESSEEFKNKGRVLKLYQEMDKELDSKQTLEDLDLKAVFCKNGKYSKQQVSINADVFVWLYLDMAKARRLSKFDILNGLDEKIREVTELERRVEYQTALAIYNALCEKEDAGVGFLTSLLDGGFATYEYDKNLIGLFKRFASSTLAYSGEPMEDYYRNDLHSFAATQIGSVYMKDLEIYDKYPPIEKKEENQETKTEEDALAENKEETKE